MSLLTADNLSITYGMYDIFAGISISIANDSKIGLIGPNGIGKTSLMLILGGIQAPTSGRVNIARGRRIGYLRQEAVEAFADRSNTVFNEMMTVFADLSRMQEQLHEMEAQMETGNLEDSLLEAYGQLQTAFEHAGGYEIELTIQQTLEGLGLGKKTWQLPLSQLSGGQKTRALLARLLLEKPDLLMLDEPTNHLDLEAVEWLEKTLKDWGGAVLIFSHDRYFLDNTVNTIWEMTRSGMEEYSGNYSSYLLQRQERWDYYERVYTEEKARLQNEVDFIQRNWVRASTHARALGLLRRISRELEIVENFGIMALRNGKNWSEMDLHVERHLDVIEAIRKVNAIEMTRHKPLQIKPRIKSSGVSGTYVLRARNVEIGYPGHSLFTIDDMELRRGACVALVGPNGSGKTTFLKVLLGQLETLRGELQTGSNLKIGYFAQSQDSLKGEQSVLDEFISRKPMLPEPARKHLAAYLFRGDDVFKPVCSLSGGERARLALALLALDGANFLVLDEPTNHLDIPAREALQEVLAEFSGTILLVSHDRYLIDQLATQIWDIQDQKLQIFNGTYRELILRKAVSASKAVTRQTLLTPRPMLRGNDMDTKRKKEALNRVEGRIREQENLIQKLSADLQGLGSGQNFNRMQKVSWQLAEAQAQLEHLMTDWERLAA